MRNLMLAASKYAAKGALLEEVSLLDLLVSTTGLSVNGDGEIYAPSLQQTAGGDGRVYNLKPRQDGRLIKSIKANFRYAFSVSALSSFYFYKTPNPANPSDYYFGVIDDKNAAATFTILDNDFTTWQNATATMNRQLIRDFPEPIALESLIVRVGGRTGYSYTPIYMKNLILETVPA